jgi:hypothetical protein
MNPVKNIALTLGILLTTQSLAQIVVSGIIVDVESAPIAYANITIGNFGSCSNETGHFEIKLIELSSNTVLKISCIGYQTKQLSLPKHKSNEIDLGLIQLDSKTSELSEIVISAKQLSIQEILKKVNHNLSKNYDPKPFSRDIYAVVTKYDATGGAIQKIDVVLEEHYSKGYTKNKRKTADLLQGRVSGSTIVVDDEEFFWIDLFFLRRHDAFSYSHPYSSPKLYNYSIDKTIYEYDGVEIVALNYELINPSAGNDGGWPNAVRIFGTMYINEIDYAILKIEETILLKDYDPNEKSEQARKFDTAIKFKKLLHIVNFKKSGEFYYLSNSHVERTYSSAQDSVSLVKSHLIVTAYKNFNKDCNPCNLNFSKTKKDPEFWNTHTTFSD